MSQQQGAPDQHTLVGRSYTRARRHPWVIGRIQGWTLPLGPFSATQLGVLVISLWLLIQTASVWTQFGPFSLVPVIIPFAATWAVLAVAGWAERVITAYVEGDIDTVRLAFPSISDGQLSALPTPEAAPTRVSTVAVEPTNKAWAVTVAVYPPRQDPESSAVRHLQLAVYGTDDSWAALTLPAEVGTWGPHELPDLAYTSRKLADSPLTEAVQGWAAAYLIGDGELDRYLAPDATHPPITMAHTSVEVDGVYPAQTDEDAATTPPGDGDSISVLVDLTITTADGQTWPMSYALELSSRSQRWEISAAATSPLI